MSSRAEGAAQGTTPIALVPRFGPLPSRAWIVVIVAVSLAWVLCLPGSASPREQLIGGAPDLPGSAFAALEVLRCGLGQWSHTRVLMYPTINNLFAQMSFPADAVIAWPFLAMLGWPLGFNVLSVLVLAAAGAAAGLFAASWWRSTAAGVAAVVATQTSGVIIREITEGRLLHVYGVPCALLALWGFSRAVVEDRGRYAFLAGVSLGVAALTFWYQAVWIGLPLLVIAAAAGFERLPVWRHVAWGAAGAFAVAGFPLIYTVLHAGAHPGSEVTAFGVIADGPGRNLSLIRMLEGRDAFNDGWITGAWRPRPLIVVLCVLAMVGERPRRWLAPAGWIALAWLMAAGPLWGSGRSFGSVLSPTIIAYVTPVLRRFWWPDRYLLMAVPGVAVLAAGGVARCLDWLGGRKWIVLPGFPVPRDRVPLLRALRARSAVLVAGLLAGGLIAEAYIVHPTLPIESLDARPSAVAAAAARRTGPMLQIPTRDLSPDARYFVWDPTLVVSQLHHGRPILTGLINPEATVASAAYRDFWNLKFLQAFRACEQGILLELAPVEIWYGQSVLARAGVTDVYVDSTWEGPAIVAVTFRSCIERFLGEPVETGKGYRRYEIAPSADWQAPATDASTAAGAEAAPVATPTPG